jgi:hypothetical protein
MDEGMEEREGGWGVEREREKLIKMIHASISKTR